jgi:nucleoside-diphosphate-sugar epimerase
MCSGYQMCLASGASPITTRQWPRFCHNIARGLPIQVNDPAAPVTLVYVDDVIARFVQLMDGADACCDADGFAAV